MNKARTFEELQDAVTAGLLLSVTKDDHPEVTTLIDIIVLDSRLRTGMEVAASRNGSIARFYSHPNGEMMFISELLKLHDTVRDILIDYEKRTFD